MSDDLPVILNFRRSLQNISHIHLIYWVIEWGAFLVGKIPYFGPTCLVLKWLQVTFEGFKWMCFLPLQSHFRFVYMDPCWPVFSVACRLYPLFTFVYPYQYRNVRLLCSTLFLLVWCQTDSAAVNEVEFLLLALKYSSSWRQRMLAVSCYLQSIKLPLLHCLGCGTFN